ncbi:hypothetical protein PuT2_13705 [Pusillimonas sp. T2]|uniref:TetR/AcrR family transcriptional regulator n=1 Tax=Pusillimonas sp. T2 TaxID=1548123 RepID=UPI000B9464D9|nr:TetR/AcrR family transcriptional regulator [Pusillimonas sp. T2]OXR48243.1 hypothetical protein PuT2_13705 [Pusillimonas sp. T2]
MVQVKKTEVEQAITAAARTLFKTHGYAGTKIPQIAKAAGMSAANIYVYFDGKADILLSVYDAWFANQLEALKARIDQCTSSELALRTLFVAMWQELPAADNGFCSVLIEALSDRSIQDKYSPRLRNTIEANLKKLLTQCLPAASTATHQTVTTLLIMAFDGYALNFHLKNGQTARDEDIDTLCRLFLSCDDASPKK